MTSFYAYLSVAAGGALGASMRYGLGLLLAGDVQRIPWSTLSVNVLGCFLAGFITASLGARGTISPIFLLFLTTGMLGGFTTFSAFSIDTLRLAEAGQLTLAAVNIVVNLFGSLLSVATGWWLAKSLFAS